VCGHPVQRTQVRTDGCKTLFGIQSRPAGVMNQNSDMISLLCTRHFRSAVSGRPRMSS
jgi:hypothetical protein